MLVTFWFILLIKFWSPLNMRLSYAAKSKHDIIRTFHDKIMFCINM